MSRRKSGQGSKDTDPTAVGKAAKAGESGRARPVTAFDLFLDRGLHRMFDAVKDEPVPEELLRIIEDDRKK